MPHHFRILKKLGSGAMGDVCLAFDEHLHRNVALKFPSRTSMGEESHTRLLNEARVASALNHPHICTIYEVIEVDGRTCIAMEYIEGHPLDEKIPRTGLPPESIVHYGVQISDALEYAHEHGVIHRDLKSSNIVVNDDGCAKVLDFGLAVRHLGAATPQAETQSSTYSANFAGTPQYTAPELFRGSKPDVRTDIWALGVILYEMASGALPFHGETLFELATAIQRDEPAPVSASLPAVIRTVIWRCLAKDPTQRYQHAGEIRAALEVITANRVSASPLVGGLRGGVRLIANVTGLDFIGIPVVTVCRPNSRSISVAQGKGVTPVAAKASGLMESIELYHAEKITLPLKLASYEELRYTHVLVDVDQLPRCAGSLFHPFLQLLWIEGIDLLQDEYVWLPYEMVHTNFTPPLPSGSGCFWLTSSGLASGNHPLEALSHALCELVECDSVTLWALRAKRNTTPRALTSAP